MKEENIWIKFYQQTPEDGQDVELKFLDGSVEPMKWSKAKIWNPEFTDLPDSWRPLLNSDKNAKECDASEAKSIDEPLAQNSFKEELEKAFPISDIEGNWLDIPQKNKREGAEWAYQYLMSSKIEAPISKRIGALIRRLEQKKKTKSSYHLSLPEIYLLLTHFKNK